MTFFDNGVKIITVPSNRQKYLKNNTQELVKSKNKKIEKTSITSFLFCLKNETKKYFKNILKKVLTTRKRYAKISFVHTERTNKKVHWKVNNRIL